jgi:hypothetical protein
MPRPPADAGPGDAGQPSYPYCDGLVLQCNSWGSCNSAAVACCPDIPEPVCHPRTTCDPTDGGTGPLKYCCSDADCTPPGICLLMAQVDGVGAPKTIGTCTQ